MPRLLLYFDVKWLYRRLLWIRLVYVSIFFNAALMTPYRIQSEFVPIFNHCCILEISQCWEFCSTRSFIYMLIWCMKGITCLNMSRPLAHMSSFVINFSVSKFCDDKDISEDTNSLGSLFVAPLSRLIMVAVVWQYLMFSTRLLCDECFTTFAEDTWLVLNYFRIQGVSNVATIHKQFLGKRPIQWYCWWLGGTDE